MQRVIDISLTGHTRRFRLTEEAYDRLDRYLGHARARLGADPDASEVITDLERSIGERLAALAPADEVLDAGQVGGVLDQTGAVDAGPPAGATAPRARPRRTRKLYRIREGQSIAGVCTGLSAYSEIGLSWVQFVFMILLVITGGLFLFVYIALMFMLPVVDTRADWERAMAELDGARTA